jgi:methionine-rich copper-binding protein CopC
MKKQIITILTTAIFTFIIAGAASATTDISSPNVTSIDPANNAVNVPSNKVIKVTFNENIKPGNNNITLVNSGGKEQALTKSIIGNVLTITPTSGALTESKYRLMIYPGAVTDLAGNPVALKTSYFIVGNSPNITSIDPANNAVNVPLNKEIKVTFNENIKPGNNFNLIELKNSGGIAVAIIKSIPTFYGGNVLTITPTSGALTESKYTLTIPYGAITDLAGNPVALKISSFIAGNSPKITSIDPANNAVNVPSNKVIKVTFNENIKIGNINCIQLTTMGLKSTGPPVAFTYSIIGNIMTIKPTNALTEGIYKLKFQPNAVTDLAGNPYNPNIMLPGLIECQFSVGTSPTITNIDPANNAVNVATNKFIKVTFNEAIKPGNNFWIELKNSTGVKVSIQKSISGNVLTIIGGVLAKGVKYTLIIHNGSVTDLAGNPVAQITSVFTTTA